jgi:erythronate-4-phosphate dehydrogenase
MTRLVTDENIAAVRDAFGPLGNVVTTPGRDIGTEDVSRADALIVRSLTRVDRTLLSGSHVRFVGTATSGVDHIDRDWLAERGITFAHAPGCNASAVADWVIAALAALHAQQRHRFATGSVGVIGAGHVGSRVARRLAQAGYSVRVCDPPRADAEGGAGFVTLDEALACDVVTLHTPLVDGGAHPTRGLIDAAALAQLRAGAVLINAARGGIVDEDALATRLDDGPDLVSAIDTWANEPAIDTALLPRVDLATPHIAGHTREGRLRGTAQVAAAAAAHFGLASTWDWRGELPPAPTASAGPDPVESVLAAYDPRADDARLRGLLTRPASERRRAFDAIRAACPQRREFAFFGLTEAAPAELRSTGLGVREADDRAA